MILLEVNKISKNFGYSPVFEELSFFADDNSRIAIVGPNGTGKTTLLNIFAGIERADKGSVVLKKNLTLGYLKQVAPDNPDNRLVKDIIKSAFSDLLEKEENLEKLMAEISVCKEEVVLNKLVEKYSRQLEVFSALGGYEMETDMAMVVKGLEIPDSVLNREYDTLSGGEKTIVHLAQILISKPEVLLLDEPTNHLDIKRIEWLEGFLQKYKGCVIVVSHDRYFLDKIAKKVFEIYNGKGTMYAGNYSSFIQQRDQDEVKAFAEYKNQQKEIKALEEAIKKNRLWGEMGDNPTFFRRVKAMEKRLEWIRASEKTKPKTQNSLPVNFVSKDRSGNMVFNIRDLYLQRGDKILLDSANMGIYYQDKLAIIGDNGTGKTTLLKALLEEEDISYTGVIERGSNLKIGYLPQILSFEDNKESVLDCIKNNTFLNEEGARRMLAKFQFYKDDIFKSVGLLSGGEKIRIKLAILLQQEINTLVFDEPTNHIDILTREVLEETLVSFKGTVIFVSHDRYFINSVANKIIKIDNNKLKLYNGNYEYYQQCKE